MYIIWKIRKKYYEPKNLGVTIRWRLDLCGLRKKIDGHFLKEILALKIFQEYLTYTFIKKNLWEKMIYWTPLLIRVLAINTLKKAVEIMFSG